MARLDGVAAVELPAGVDAAFASRTEKDAARKAERVVRRAQHMRDDLIRCARDGYTRERVLQTQKQPRLIARFGGFAFEFEQPNRERLQLGIGSAAHLRRKPAVASSRISSGYRDAARAAATLISPLAASSQRCVSRVCIPSRRELAIVVRS